MAWRLPAATKPRSTPVKARLRRAGDLVRISSGTPTAGGEVSGEFVALVQLLREGVHGGRERWLARTEDGTEINVLVSPTTGSVTT